MANCSAAAAMRARSPAALAHRLPAFNAHPLRWASSSSSSNNKPPPPPPPPPSEPSAGEPTSPSIDAQQPQPSWQRAQPPAPDSPLGQSPPAATTASKDGSALTSNRQDSLAEQYLDFTEIAPSTTANEGDTFPGERTGARAKGESKSSIDIKRRRLMAMAVAAGLLGSAAQVVYLARDWDNEEEKQKITSRTEDKQAVEECEQGGWKAWIGRLKLRTEDFLDYMNKPAWDPLLPPPLPEPHYRPYTLVVDLDDMLVHSGWDIEHGWRTAKRPGVDYFLAYLSQFYEIVLFTTQPAYTAAPIVEKIDPYGAYIPWKLFRESTRYKNKTLIKDLSYLGRPLERTIILDTEPSHYQLQPENGIALKPWLGKRDESARELVALIPFLEALAIRGVKDVRTVIKHYEGRHIPTAYAEAEAAQKKALVDKWEKDRQSTTSRWISAALGSLTKSPSRETPPETDVEKVRRNAQRLYLEEQKYWKDNEETIKKQMAEDRDRQLAEMKTNLIGFMGLAPPKDGSAAMPQPSSPASS
ncbi:hypothetical protein ACM66B_002481 [Microbotryomycetes sp. NB124-2]